MASEPAGLKRVQQLKAKVEECAKQVRADARAVKRAEQKRAELNMSETATPQETRRKLELSRADLSEAQRRLMKEGSWM